MKTKVGMQVATLTQQAEAATAKISTLQAELREAGQKLAAAEEHAASLRSGPRYLAAACEGAGGRSWKLSGSRTRGRPRRCRPSLMSRARRTARRAAALAAELQAAKSGAAEAIALQGQLAEPAGKLAAAEAQAAELEQRLREESEQLAGARSELQSLKRHAAAQQAQLETAQEGGRGNGTCCKGQL